MSTGTRHTITAFDDDMDEIRGLIAEMGARAETAVVAAMKALTEQDTEAAAIIVSLRAYLDEQAQPILQPDDRDAAQLALPAPALEFIRVLLNMSFFIFPLTDTVHSGKRSSLMAAPVDDAGARKRSNSLVPSNAKPASAAVAPSTLLDGSADSSGKVRRVSMTGMPAKRGSAAAGSAPPIVAFLASSMCRSSQGMFADAAGGSIRCVSPPLCGSLVAP